MSLCPHHGTNSRLLQWFSAGPLSAVQGFLKAPKKNREKTERERERDTGLGESGRREIEGDFT